MNLRVHHLVVALAALLAAVSVALTLFPDEHVAVAMAGARLSIGVGVLVAYAPVLRGINGVAPLSTGFILSIGIIVGRTSQILFAAYTLGIQLDFWKSVPAAVALASSLADFSGILHLAAARAIEGRIPLRGWVAAGVFSALGAATAVAALVAVVGV